MQNSIVEYLKEHFLPDSIILHGSRARGKERPQSDWDFILLFSKPTSAKNGRVLLEGQNVEYSIAVLPVNDVYAVFETKLHKATVVFDTNDMGATLLKDAAAYYDVGVHWNQEKRDAHKLWIAGRVAGMRDSVHDPLLFQKYFSDFYSRVFNYWYWLIANQHSEPIYIAIDTIKETDPTYFKMLNDLVSPAHSPEARVELAEKIATYLFR